MVGCNGGVIGQDREQMLALGERSLRLRRERAHRRQRVREGTYDERLQIMADYMLDEGLWWGNYTAFKTIGFVKRLPDATILGILAAAGASEQRRMDQLTTRQRQVIAMALQHLALDFLARQAAA